MALSQSALSELLEAFRAGDGVDMIRESVRTVLQELVEIEAAGVIGAGRYERTEDRVTERNGTRPRLLATKAGDVELRIAKLRKGSFFPSILEPRRRIDQALYAVVMEAYVHGVSTRSVDDLVVALGADSGISKSRSRASASSSTTRGRVPHPAPGPHPVPLRLPRCDLPTRAQQARPGRPRRLDGRGGRHRDRRRRRPGGPRARRRRQRGRDVLARVPAQPQTRGLAGVRLVISDQHSGLVAALRRSFQGSAHQRCRVHFARNLLAHVPKTTPTWSPRCSARSSPNPTPRP